MKIDVERNLEKIKVYMYQVDEYKRALEDEIKKSNQYKKLMSQSKGTFSFGSNKAIEESQKLVTHLTIQLGEKDEEISVQKNIIRELGRKLKELTNNE